MQTCTTPARWRWWSFWIPDERIQQIQLFTRTHACTHTNTHTLLFSLSNFDICRTGTNTGTHTHPLLGESVKLQMIRQIQLFGGHCRANTFSVTVGIGVAKWEYISVSRRDYRTRDTSDHSLRSQLSGRNLPPPSDCERSQDTVDILHACLFS